VNLQQTAYISGIVVHILVFRGLKSGMSTGDPSAATHAVRVDRARPHVSPPITQPPSLSRCSNHTSSATIADNR
jgi:hypothetical protein